MQFLLSRYRIASSVFMLALLSSPNIARPQSQTAVLIYHEATGRLVIAGVPDAPNEQSISNFVLKTDDEVGFASAMVPTDPLGPNTLLTPNSDELSATNFFNTDFFRDAGGGEALIDLGLILPTGLDAVGFKDFVTSATYVDPNTTPTYVAAPGSGGPRALLLATVDSCDFIGNDGTCDANEADAIASILLQDPETEVSAGTTSHDLDGNGFITIEDLHLLRALAALKGGFRDRFALGDANLDGAIESNDLNALGRNWQMTTPRPPGSIWSSADFNVDGITDGADLNQIGRRWTQTIPMFPAAAPSVVPEPSAFVLCGVGALIFLHGLRRPRSKED